MRIVLFVTINTLVLTLATWMIIDLWLRWYAWRWNVQMRVRFPLFRQVIHSLAIPLLLYRGLWITLLLGTMLVNVRTVIPAWLGSIVQVTSLCGWTGLFDYPMNSLYDRRIRNVLTTANEDTISATVVVTRALRGTLSALMMVLPLKRIQALAEEYAGLLRSNHQI